MNSKRYLFLFSIALNLFFSQITFGQDAELVWLETDNAQPTIYYSEHKNNVWSTKQSLSTGSSMKFTPAIASSKNTSIAIWATEKDQANISLMYSLRRNGKWQKARDTSFSFAETTAPSLIAYQGNYYLFFAGNNGDDDDIFMSYFKNNSWTDPMMIHPDNSVPDILPEPNVISGILTVVWQQFNGDTYEFKSQTISGVSNNSATSELQGQYQNKKSKQATLQQIRATDSTKLKSTYNISLPKGFKGIGLTKAYIRDEDETPVISIEN